MINPVRMNSINTINNNQRSHSTAFKGYDDDDDEPVSIKLDDTDRYASELNDLKEAKKNFEDMSNDSNNSKVLKGALKLGAVALSGFIAGTAFKATAPKAGETIKNLLNSKAPKKIETVAQKTAAKVLSPIKKFVSAKADKLSEYKGTLDTSSKKFKVLDKAEKAVHGVKDLASKAVKAVKTKALQATSVLVGVSTSAEAYQEMKNDKEGGR